MPSKHKQCVGKRRYSKAKAKEVAFLMEMKKHEPFHHYYCIYCKMYHIGHDRRRQDKYPTSWKNTIWNDKPRSS